MNEVVHYTSGYRKIKREKDGTPVLKVQYKTIPIYNFKQIYKKII